MRNADSWKCGINFEWTSEVEDPKIQPPFLKDEMTFFDPFEKTQIFSKKFFC